MEPGNQTRQPRDPCPKCQSMSCPCPKCQSMSCPCPKGQSMSCSKCQTMICSKCQTVACTQCDSLPEVPKSCSSSAMVAPSGVTMENLNVGACTKVPPSVILGLVYWGHMVESHESSSIGFFFKNTYKK